MQVGCGVYELEIRGNRYLYFWHYEAKGGARRQVKEYLGPSGSTEAREEAARRCGAYYARAERDLRRMRGETLAVIALAR